MRPTIAPHADHGAPACCGCIFPVPRGDEADLTCNECGAIIRTVPAAEAESTLLAMAFAPGACTAVCPACGAQNVFTGLDSVLAFRCRECGSGVEA